MQTKEPILYESVETNVELMCIIKCIYFCTTVEVALQFLLRFYIVEMQHYISASKLTDVTSYSMVSSAAI
jgi:hypothetical protein